MAKKNLEYVWTSQNYRATVNIDPSSDLEQADYSGLVMFLTALTSHLSSMSTEEGASSDEPFPDSAFLGEGPEQSSLAVASA